MKKQLLAVSLLFLALSCSDDSAPEKKPQIYKAEVSPEFKAFVKELLSNTSVNSRNKRIAADLDDYDIDEMMAVSLQANPRNFALVADKKFQSPLSLIQSSIAFYAKDDAITGVALVKKKRIAATNIRIVEYYNLEGDLELTMEEHFDWNNNIVKVKKRAGTTIGSCGQEIMDCVGQVYSGAGWASVGMTIASIFEPALLGGVVGGCATACLLSATTRQEMIQHSAVLLPNKALFKPILIGG